ncbi:TauD/TfdA family taurine catabolism dioxygenase (plasmid) [Sodalis praecaptivus]|uniref:TauD/TfdA family taurine catabolism dioxygenase n=1 Tax=Sodalis praecaptivus TaxID=1239307 RepID=W0I3N8_9GAMM|nr:TauD/TfdA family dioxygenase [Sodalis praecaptivus]AHF79085.1 TauD/TfdA family taurine catabolism dioxygenase [Sodalis praecaptivus]
MTQQAASTSAGAPPAQNGTLGGLTVRPTGNALGAIVTGVDLSRPIDGAIAQALRQAWQQHLVLLFPGQSLQPGAFLRAAEIFGKPQEGANRRYIRAAGVAQDDDYPEIMLNTNLGPDGQPTRENDGLGSLEVVWHSDNSYIEQPPIGSMLYALEAPSDSGHTSFANQYLAWERLPEDLRQEINGLWAKHDASRNSAGLLRPGIALPTRPEEVPGPFHPLVIRNPENGRRALYLGRRRAFPSQFIAGLPLARSEALLDQLWAAATDASLTWTHRWTPGDVLVWDNRYCLHHRTLIDEKQRRVMWRTQFQGQPLLADAARRDPHATLDENLLK